MDAGKFRKFSVDDAASRTILSQAITRRIGAWNMMQIVTKLSKRMFLSMMPCFYATFPRPYVTTALCHHRLRHSLRRTWCFRNSEQQESTSLCKKAGPPHGLLSKKKMVVNVLPGAPASLVSIAQVRLVVEPPASVLLTILLRRKSGFAPTQEKALENFPSCSNSWICVAWSIFEGHILLVVASCLLLD